MTGSSAHLPGSTRYLYYGARFTGQTAQNILLAGIFLAAGTSGSAAMDLSSVFVAILIPAVLFGAWGGALADRLGAARAYPVGALLRFLVAGFALYALTGQGWVWAVAFAYSAASQLFTPAEMALVWSLRRGGSGSIHSALQAQQYVAQGLGMVVLAPALFWLGGLPAILVGAVAGKALLVVLTVFVSVAMKDTRAVRGEDTREAFGFRPVLSFIMSEHAVRYAVALQAFKTMVSRGVFVALPLYVTHEMGVAHDMVAFLLVPGAIGVIAGLIWARSLDAGAAAAALRLSMLGLVVSVLALAALDYGVSAVAQYTHVPPIVYLEASLNTTFVVALPVAFLLGLSLTAALVAGRVVLTEATPGGRQARVFAVQEVVSESLVVAPLLLTGIGVTYAGARPVLAVIGIAGLLLMVLLELARPRTVPGTASAESHDALAPAQLPAPAD